jgi:hypothetical protein
MNISTNTLKSNTTNSLYWKCQLLGWCTVAIYWAYTVYTRDNYSVFYTFCNYVLDVAIGIFLTHIYRKNALKANWSQLPIKRLLIRVIPSILLLAVLYVILNNLKWYGYWTLVAEEDKDIWESLSYWDPILLTGLRLMSIWILAYHLYHYYQKEVVTAREYAQLSLIAKQAQLDNLSAQLNPHFLFNSLNSIKSLIVENPDIARRGIDLLSDLLRSSLYEKDKDLISIKNELALVNDYIELEKLRFEERLTIDLTIDKSLDHFKIPTLSIQLLVENAIKHGIDKIIEGGLITLKISKNGDQVYIQVQNPGKLSAIKSTRGLGLMNLKKRLELQYNKEASFSLEELDNNVVQATLTLPFKEDENI